jgi:hypothetical protein
MSVQSDKNGNVTTDGASGSYVQVGAVRHYGFNTAITENVTVTSAPAGSRATTTHATGRTKSFYSDGAKWQLELDA